MCLPGQFRLAWHFRLVSCLHGAVLCMRPLFAGDAPQHVGRLGDVSGDVFASASEIVFHKTWILMSTVGTSRKIELFNRGAFNLRADDHAGTGCKGVLLRQGYSAFGGDEILARCLPRQTLPLPFGETAASDAVGRRKKRGLARPSARPEACRVHSIHATPSNLLRAHDRGTQNRFPLFATCARAPVTRVREPGHKKLDPPPGLVRERGRFRDLWAHLLDASSCPLSWRRPAGG